MVAEEFLPAAGARSRVITDLGLGGCCVLDAGCTKICVDWAEEIAGRPFRRSSVVGIAGDERS
jgi:hypothetical protein